MTICTSNILYIHLEQLLCVQNSKRSAVLHPWWPLIQLVYSAINSSVQFSCSVMTDSLQPHGLQHTRPPCPSPTPGVYSNSCPLSWWCHPTISSSVVPFSSCLQSFPASGSFLASQYFTWPMNWNFSFSISPSNEYLGQICFRTGWISLLSKGLSSH